VTDRLPRMTPGCMNPAQRRVYDHILASRQTTGLSPFPLCRTDGSLTGPFNVMAVAPVVGAPLSALGAALRSDTSLSPRAREFAILTVAAWLGSEYEWESHSAVARSIGVSEAELSGIRGGSGPRVSDEHEAAVVGVVRAVLERADLSDTEYEDAVSTLGCETLVELVVLVGYYELLGRLLTTFRANSSGDS